MLFAHFTTSEGNFTIKLFEEEAPQYGGEFRGLAEGTKEWTDPKSGQKVKRPYYNGLIFHRVIGGFMIQGAIPWAPAPAAPATNSPTSSVPKLRHSKPGMLSMANAGPALNGSQFFITPRGHSRGSTTSTASSAKWWRA